MEAINKHLSAFPRSRGPDAASSFLQVNLAVPASVPDPECARMRFHALMRRLDRWLDAPLGIARDSRGHIVWLAAAVGYRVDRGARAVYPVVREEGRVRRGAFTVDVANFLRKPAWLGFILRREGLSDAGSQAHLFSSQKAIRAEEDWLCGAALDCLRGDARYRALRRHRLREALGLDPSLVGIALAARALPEGGNLSSDAFTFAWRHEIPLRAAARENPQLLPLVAIAMREGRIPPFDDAVEPLHALFAERGLKPATWRFLARHGVDWLRPVWEAATKGALTEATIEALRVFEAAGHPSPPPPEIMRDWVDWADACPTLEAPGNWKSVPAAVLAACCEGARDFPLEAARRAEISMAFEWSAGEQPKLDKLQRRAGWPWVRRQSLAWERRWRLSQIEGPAFWPAPVAVHEASGLRARALTSAVELVDAGLAFHNCLADLAENCADGTMHVFVVEEVATGRGVAVVALTVFAAAKQWRVMDVKGVCNEGVGEKVEKFAADLLEVFNRRRAA